jgi:hypothetical protein
VHETAVPADGQQPAGQPPVVHVPGEVLVDAAQPVRVDADLGRVGLTL